MAVSARLFNGLYMFEEVYIRLKINASYAMVSPQAALSKLEVHERFRLYHEAQSKDREIEWAIAV